MKARGRVLLAVGLLLVPSVMTGQDTARSEPERPMEGLSTSGGPLADSATEALATRIAAALRCPVCQGLSIQDSPSPLAQQMKDLIRAQLMEGRSEAEVKDYFVSKYGEWVLMEPRAEGFNLLVYLLPALGLLAGGGVIAMAVRRWTAPPEEATGGGA